MPIYAFRCAACGHQFDRLQKLSDPDPEVCPACGVRQVGRQVTAPSFRLSGSGWYETDFKKDGQRNVARKDDAGAGSAASDGKSTDTGPADTKPAHSCGSGCGCA